MHRLCKFGDMQEVESALDRLMERSDGPFVAKLPREPGKREARFMHLFSGDAPAMEFSGSANIASDLSGAEINKLDQLEQRVDELEQEIAQLKRALEQPGPKPTTGYMEA